MDKRIDLTLDNTFKVVDSVDNRMDIGIVNDKLIITPQINKAIAGQMGLAYLCYDKYGNYLCDRCGDAIIFNYNDSTLCDNCTSTLESQMKADSDIFNIIGGN